MKLTFNEKLARDGAIRARRFLNMRKTMSAADIAKREKITESRVNMILAKARRG